MKKTHKRENLYKAINIIIITMVLGMDALPLWGSFGMAEANVTDSPETSIIEETPEEGNSEENIEDEIEDEIEEPKIDESEGVEEELIEEELIEEELIEEELIEAELIEEELIEEELVEELTNTDKETNVGKGMLTTTFGTKVKSNITNSNEAMFATTSTIPPNYVLATDADFNGSRNGLFRYNGTDEYVIIPHVIKGDDVTSYKNMFMGTSVKGVVSTNKNVTDMSSMFSSSRATSLDLRNLDTSNVTNMSSMFQSTLATSLNVSNFDTSNVTNMSSMFNLTQATSLNLSSFDTSNVTNMSSMFQSSKATSLNLSSFDTSNVTNMSGMFRSSQAPSLDLSSFDTSNVTNMYNMFHSSQATSLDLSNFDTSSVTDNRYMFYGSKATTGYARTKEDADRFNGSSDIPSGLTFIVYDKDAPTGTITGNPTSWTRQNITLTFNATDINGVKRVQRPDGTWVNGSSTTHTVTTNGTYTFKAEDNYGNTGTFSVTVNRIDKTIPTVTFGTNGNSTARQSHSTTVNVADSGGSGVATRQYQWSTGTATPTGTWTNFSNGQTITRSSGTGNYYLHIRATDNVGNVRNSRSNAFNMDNTAPTTPTLSASTTAWTNGNVTVTGTYSTDSTVKQYRIGSGSWQNYTAPFTVSSNATIQARAQDSAGNWSTTRSLVISNIDKTLPNGTISANTTAHTSGNVTLTFNATDTGGSGVRRVRVSGGSWVNGSTTTQSATSNGTYSFEVEDNAGNTRTVSRSVSNIDKTIPTVSLSKNGGGYAKTHSTVISASDNLSGVNTIQYRWTANTTFPTSGLTTVTSGTTVSTPTTDGNHYLHVRATDKVGNVRNFTSNVFRVDRTAPTHESNTVTGQRYTSGTNYWVRPNDVLTVTFRQQDTLSGNQSGYIRLLGNSQDVRYFHQFAGTATNMTPVNASFVNTSSIEVQSVNRTEHSTSTGYGTTQWKVKLNTMGHNYELQYYHRDNASNNRGYITVGRVRVDGVAPTVTLTPNTTGHTNQNVTITATASDADSGVKRIQRPDGTWVNGSTTTHTVTSNGTYSFVVEDNVGNQRTQTITVSNIDKTLPTVSFGTNGSSTPRQTHSTTVNVTDTQSGVATRQYQWTTSTATPTSGTWTNFSNGQTITRSSGTGNYYLHIRATDNAGNVRNSRTNAFNLDNTAPTTPTLSSSTTGWTNGNVSVTINYPSDASVKQYRIDSGSWQNYSSAVTMSSNGTVQARAQDSAGNWSAVGSINVTNIDKTVPNGSITGNPTSWTNSNATLTFNATDSGGSGVRRVRVKGGTWVNGATTTQVATQNGTYAFEVEDNAGNTREVSVAVNRIDKTLPNGTITGNPTSWTNSNQTLTFNATDSGGSGVRRVRVKGGTWVNGTTTTQVATQNGTYAFEVEDNAGNTREVSVNVNRIDKTLPNGSITGNPTSWTNNNQTLTFTATDSGGSGVRRVRVKDGTWVNGSTTTLSVSSNGTYVFTVEDNAGNTRDVSVVVNRIDKSLPTVSYGTNGNNTWVKSQSTTVSVADTGSGVTTRQYQWTTSATFPTSGTWTNFTNGETITRNSGTGNYYLHIKATDNAGNVRQSTSNVFRVDNTIPAMTVTGNPTAWVNSNQTLTVNVTDGNSGVKRLQLPDNTWVNGSTTTYTVSANGTYVFKAEDNSGNVREVSVAVNRIDKTLPNGTITGNPTSWTNSNQTLTFTATDAGGSGVRRVRVKDGSWVSGATTTLVVTQNGTYAFEVEDNAGNTREVSVVVDKVDKSIPTGVISGNPTTWVNSNQTLTFTATDTGGSGVRRVRVKNGSWVNGATTSLTVSANGTYAFEVEDNAGNTREVSVVVNRIDKTLPTVSYGTNGDSTPSKTHSTTVTATDTGSGVATRQYQWTTSATFPTSGTWTNFNNGQTITRNTGTGNIYLHTRVVDNAGNTTQLTSNAFNMDNTAPIEPTFTPSTTGWTNGNVLVTINYPTDANIREYRLGSGQWSNYTARVSITNNNSLFARAFDLAGNESGTSSLNITNIDKVAPTLQVTGNPTDWDERDDITLTVRASDDLSGIQNITLPNNTVVTRDTATYSVSENGTYVFKTRDRAGNERINTVEVTRLMIPYSLYIYDSNNTPVTGATFELIRDEVLYRTATTDNDGYLDFGKVPPVGSYRLRQITNSDGVGITDPVEIEPDVNEPSTPDSPIEYPVGETLEEPEISINPNIWTNKDVVATITYAPEATVKHYKVNDGEWLEYTDPIMVTENSTLYARSYDEMGNWSPETEMDVTVIDKVMPTVTVESNTTKWVADKVEITVTARDSESGVLSVTSQQELKHTSQEVTGDTVVTKYVVDKNEEYRFTVTDVAGNSATGVYMVSNIDKTPPELTVTGNPTEWFRDYELVLEVNALDTQSGVKQVTLPDGEVLTGDEALSTSYKVTDNGVYEFIVEDNVGNIYTVTEEVTRLEKEFSITVSGKDNKPLEGTKFELYRDGELIETSESNQDGRVDFGKVYTSGDYELKQTIVPEGYRLNSLVQNVDVTQENMVIINYHQSELLPGTGTSDALMILGAILVTSVSVALVELKKRQSKGYK